MKQIGVNGNPKRPVRVSIDRYNAALEGLVHLAIVDTAPPSTRRLLPRVFTVLMPKVSSKALQYAVELVAQLITNLRKIRLDFAPEFLLGKLPSGRVALPWVGNFVKLNSPINHLVFLLKLFDNVSRIIVFRLDVFVVQC